MYLKLFCPPPLFPQFLKTWTKSLKNNSSKFWFLYCNLYDFSLFFISGVTVTLSTLIDGKNFQAGGHKVGLALELEA